MTGPQITVVGHLAGAPKSRVLAGGTVVADFRIATTPRRQDKTTGEWTDLETLWFGVSCWRALAEHAALSLNKGDRVIVTGRLLTRSWTADNGEQRSGLEIDASSIGMDLSRGPVIQRRVERTTSVPAQPAGEPVQDPWATPGGAPDPVTGEVESEETVAA